MKIDAEIKFLITDTTINITTGQTVCIPVDADYVEDFDDVINDVESQLYEKYGTNLRISLQACDGCDFIITNAAEICEELSNIK